MNAWLVTEFEGGRHSISLNLIDEMEKALYAKGKREPKGSMK